MRKRLSIPIAALAVAALPALAQDPALPQPPVVQPPAVQPPQAVQPQVQAQPQRDPAPEGFFKPKADIAIGSSLEAVVPAPATQQAQSATPTVEALLADSLARDAAERELDRARQDHDRALAEAARTPPPMIVSPLDGTAPILSPLGR